MLIQLEIGDNTRDGHERFVTRIVESSLDPGGLHTSYRKGVQQTGFDLQKEFQSYESAKDGVPVEYWDTFMKALQAFDPISYADWEPEWAGDEWSLDPDLYLHAWLGLALIGNPELKVFEVALPQWDIGGYGLFS